MISELTSVLNKNRKVDIKFSAHDAFSYRYICLTMISELYKRQRTPKEQQKKDNPEKLATLGTQDTGRRQAKQ